MQFRRHLREAPLCRSKLLGSFSLRDILIANGTMPPPTPDAPKPEIGVIEAAFGEMGDEQLSSLCTAAQQSLELVRSIAASLAQHVGEGRAPQFGEFRSILDDLSKQVEGQLAKRHGGVSAAAAASPGGNGSGSVPGEIRSTRDVIA